MKKLISVILAATMLILIIPFSALPSLQLFSISARAVETDEQGLEYTLSEDGTYYSVTGCTGIVADISIPETYNEIPVTRIENDTFSDVRITTLAIPPSITYMAGHGVPKIVYITDVAAWCGIMFPYAWDNPLYYGADLYLNGNKITDLVIPDTVTTIETWAFYRFYSLTSVTIPDSVTFIKNGVFRECDNLEAVYYMGDIESWCNIEFERVGSASNPLSNGADLYLNGEKVTDLVIPDTVTNIKSQAFYGCPSLTSIIIPDSVTVIEEYAFYDCSSLTSATIPDSVTTIEAHAFGDCISLTDVTIPDSVTSIGNWAFYHCTSLKNITIPNSVTYIDGYAFYGCSSLTSVDLPEKAHIGTEAFSSCTSLKNITIPNYAEIGDKAFNGCTSLTSVTLLDSITLGSNVFNECTSLTELTVTGSISCNNQSFAYNTNRYLELEKIYIYDLALWCEQASNFGNVLKCGAELYLNNEIITELVIPDSVTYIDGYAFYGCSSLTSVTVPDSVTYIYAYAFYGCSSLTSVTLPDSITRIYGYTFYGCTALANVTIPDSVTVIGDSAFYGCSSLTSVTLPDSVTTIEEYAFYNCYIDEFVIKSPYVSVDTKALDTNKVIFLGIAENCPVEGAYCICTDREHVFDDDNDYFCNNCSYEKFRVYSESIDGTTVTVDFNELDEYFVYSTDMNNWNDDGIFSLSANVEYTFYRKRSNFLYDGTIEFIKYKYVGLCSVTYSDNGGYNAPDAHLNLPIGTKITVSTEIPSHSKSHYWFQYWKCNNTKYVPGDIITVMEDMVLYAVWHYDCGGCNNGNCKLCDGKGYIDFIGGTCKLCGGEGHFMQEVIIKACHLCGGSGTFGSSTCSLCKGKGGQTDYLMAACPDCRGSGYPKCTNCNKGNCFDCLGLGYAVADIKEIETPVSQRGGVIKSIGTMKADGTIITETKFVTDDDNTEGGNTEGGNTEGGNTEGGNTEGGNTEGGNTEGGNTEGGNTEGGNTEGGNTEGGNTEGGNTEGGNTEGGNTEGGNTEGGNTEGGNTEGGNSTPNDNIGDVNDDDVINQYDYILVKRHYFATRLLTESELVRADVNSDGAIDQFDYILIKRHYFGTFTIGG